MDRVHGRVVCQTVELVALGREWEAVNFWNRRSDCLTQFRVRVQSSSNCRTTHCQFVQLWTQSINVSLVVLQSWNVTWQFLTKCQWRCILQVRTTNLDCLPEGVLLNTQFINQVGQWLFNVIDCFNRHNVHRRWEDIVWWLPHVHVVVRQDLQPTLFTCQVSNHFVCVHVCLRTWTSLVNR